MQDRDPQPTAILEPPSTPAKPSPDLKDKKGWVQFSEERSFGSLTGSEFRIWGDNT